MTLGKISCRVPGCSATGRAIRTRWGAEWWLPRMAHPRQSDMAGEGATRVAGCDWRSKMVISSKLRAAKFKIASDPFHLHP